MASLGQLKNLRTDLKEHRINALEGNQKTIDPNQKRRQNATRFCGYCRTNGQTPSFCRKKIRYEEVKKLQNEATAEKKITFTHDYNKWRGPSHRSGNWTRQNDDNGAMMSTPRSFTGGNFGQVIRFLADSDKTDLSSEETTRVTTIIGSATAERDHQPYQSDQDQSRNWGSNNNYSRSPSTAGQGSSFTDSRRQPRLNSPNPSVLIPKTRSSQPPIMVVSRTSFGSIQQTMKWMNYRDYAL